MSTYWYCRQSTPESRPDKGGQGHCMWMLGEKAVLSEHEKNGMAAAVESIFWIAKMLS